jgi:hypothetical protein
MLVRPGISNPHLDADRPQLAVSPAGTAKLGIAA